MEQFVIPEQARNRQNCLLIGLSDTVTCGLSDRTLRNPNIEPGENVCSFVFLADIELP